MFNPYKILRSLNNLYPFITMKRTGTKIGYKLPENTAFVYGEARI